jgi:hypothetical protein
MSARRESVILRRPVTVERHSRRHVPPNWSRATSRSVTQALGSHFTLVCMAQLWAAQGHGCRCHRQAGAAAAPISPTTRRWICRRACGARSRPATTRDSRRHRGSSASSTAAMFGEMEGRPRPHRDRHDADGARLRHGRRAGLRRSPTSGLALEGAGGGEGHDGVRPALDRSRHGPKPAQLTLGGCESRSPPAFLPVTPEHPAAGGHPCLLRRRRPRGPAQRAHFAACATPPDAAEHEGPGARSTDLLGLTLAHGHLDAGGAGRRAAVARGGAPTAQAPTTHRPEAAAQRGVAVFNGPFSNTRSVAELGDRPRDPAAASACRSARPPRPERGEWAEGREAFQRDPGKTLGIASATARSGRRRACWPRRSACAWCSTTSSPGCPWATRLCCAEPGRTAAGSRRG